MGQLFADATQSGREGDGVVVSVGLRELGRWLGCTRGTRGEEVPQLVVGSQFRFAGMVNEELLHWSDKKESDALAGPCFGKWPCFFC